MQTITMYVVAGDAVGKVTDRAGAKNISPPTFVLGLSAELKLRLLSAEDSSMPLPESQFDNISSWEFYLDRDYDKTTGPLAVTTQDITLTSGTDSDGAYTELSIAISLNSDSLHEALGTAEVVSGLIGELVGFDNQQNIIYLLHIKGFAVRNRVAGVNNFAENSDAYYTAAQTDQKIKETVNAAIGNAVEAATDLAGTLAEVNA